MTDSRPPNQVLRLPYIEAIGKRVIQDKDFTIRVLGTNALLGQLATVTSLIKIGGDLSPYYRRSTRHDVLLRSLGVLHLHLGGPGSDTLLYLMQFPMHVLLLCVDTHIHLDDMPPGRRLSLLGANLFRRALGQDAAEEAGRKAAAIAKLRQAKPRPR